MRAEKEKPNPPETASETGRWIRPATDASRGGLQVLSKGLTMDEVATAILRETRRRVSGLVELERQLEDRIRSRWEENEAEIRRKMARSDEDVAASRKRLDGELKEMKLRAEKDGRAAGFREGFARGREEGYRLGLEEGRREGYKEGEERGRDDASRGVEKELSGAAAALAAALAEFHEKRENLLLEARRGLLTLSIEIAKKILKRELREVGETAVHNIEKAVELIFRRGTLVIHVSPEDAPIVERTLAAEPRWMEGFDSVEVRPAAEVTRGGCRLVSGAGTVDMTLETQLSLIESALESADELSMVPADSTEGDIPQADAQEGAPT